MRALAGGFWKIEIEVITALGFLIANDQGGKLP